MKILAWLHARGDEMVRMLTEAALLESPSSDPAAQDPVLELFADRLRSLGFRCRRLAGQRSGGQLLAMPGDYRRGMPRQLLLGHCDTVWSRGTLAKMPVESRDGRLHGPGVYDMKGGLVQAVFALAALRDLGLQPRVAPLCFINSDEEIGSGESARSIGRLARIVDRALVMEPSLGPQGHLKTTRKGVGRYTVTVIGRAAHAGLDPEKGVSAILELSHVVQALFALNDPSRGITVNVGTIDGGLRPNVIAAQSRAEVDVRTRTLQDAEQIERAITAIQPTVAGTRLQVVGGISRPPLEPTPGNRRLWQLALEAGAALGIELDQAAAGGGSDGNWTSLYTPTLDGLGAVGDGAHAVHEHVIEAMMPPRAALLACLLLSGPLASSRS
jgi:glutamate carboxypeptidase